MTPRYRRNARIAGGALAGVFVLLQLARPALPRPPVLADLVAPPEIHRIFKDACYDCHSNETRLLWFDQIVPAYWLVVHDVREGRAHLDFSDFATLPPPRRQAVLYEAVNQIRLRAMPPGPYLAMHSGATVSAESLARLEKYLHPGSEDSEAAAAPLLRDEPVPPPRSQVAPEPNGVAFFPGYQNWKLVSTTDRYDNGTLRFILGNDVAMRAIASNAVDPWPDGAAFAKIGWVGAADSTGVIRPGAFKQVEFMSKDAKGHAATEGWAFGRWLGAELAPYGKSPDLAEECTGCHAPMRHDDFVYTMPIHTAPGADDRFNREAGLPSKLPFDPFAWRPLTTSVDKRAATTSTLFGNDAAVDHARSGSRDPYPAGAVLCEVTWTQREDAHWFGARIAGSAVSIELVSFAAPGSAPAYERYEGSPLAKAAAPENASVRVDAITAERAAVLPYVASP
jgi:hypothetical protein